MIATKKFQYIFHRYYSTACVTSLVVTVQEHMRIETIVMMTHSISTLDDTHLNRDTKTI